MTVPAASLTILVTHTSIGTGVCLCRSGLRYLISLDATRIPAVVWSTPDSGTAWECGYAFAKGKPIVCYRTDFRITGDTEGAPYNLMLSESATARFEIAFRTKPEEFRGRVLEHIREALAAGGRAGSRRGDSKIAKSVAT